MSRINNPEIAVEHKDIMKKSKHRSKKKKGKGKKGKKKKKKKKKWFIACSVFTFEKFKF